MYTPAPFSLSSPRPYRPHVLSPPRPIVPTPTSYRPHIHPYRPHVLSSPRPPLSSPPSLPYSCTTQGTPTRKTLASIPPRNQRHIVNRRLQLFRCRLDFGEPRPAVPRCGTAARLRPHPLDLVHLGGKTMFLCVEFCASLWAVPVSSHNNTHTAKPSTATH